MTNVSPTPTTTPQTAAPSDDKPATRTALLPWLAERGIFVVTAALIVGAAIFVDGFASVTNITDVLNRVAPIGIAAVGMTFVVISGNYVDLSIVPQVATSAVILIGISNDYGLPAAFAAAILVAIVFGLVNGVAVGYFKANAVIVTLATTYIGLGLLRWLSGGSIFFGPTNGPIATFGQTEIASVPLSVLVLLIVAVVLAFTLNRTGFGFSVRAIGSNKEATRLAGVSTSRVVLGAFVVTSLSAMVAGFVLAAFSNTAVSSMSVGYDFQALAAIIIGGTSVFGGRGSILRTVIGVVFVSVLTNILVLLKIGYGWQQVAIGALIVVAVSLDTLARKVGQ